METHYFTCQCSDFRHTFRFVFDPQDGDIWLEVQLINCEPWYKRALNAVRYVLGFPAAYGHYDVTLLREEDYDKIRGLLARSEKAKERALSWAQNLHLRRQDGLSSVEGGLSVVGT